MVTCDGPSFRLLGSFKQHGVASGVPEPYFTLQGFRVYTGNLNRFPVIFVSGLSPSLGHQAPTDGPGASNGGSTHWLSGFSFPPWEAVLSFPNSSVLYLKNAFSALVFKKRREKCKYYIRIYIYVCVLACVCIKKSSGRIYKTLIMLQRWW